MKKVLLSNCFKGLIVLCLLINTLIAQSPVQFLVSTEVAEVNENVCVEISTNDFTNVISLQLPVSWDPFLLSNPTLENEALNFSISNIDFEKGELRYIWEDSSLSNPVTFDNGQVLFELCYTVVDGKGEFTPIEIIDLQIPLFEPLVLDSSFVEVPIEVTNGGIDIADDCNGIAFVPSTVCQNDAFDLNVELSSQGISINDFGYWIIDGHTVLPADEGSNINSGVFIEKVASFFAEDYNEQVKVILEDTLEHTFEYLYAFINCDTTTTPEFVVKALAQPESLDLEIPDEICYNEDLIINFDIEQPGTFELAFSINGIDSIFKFDANSDSLNFMNLTSDIELDFNSVQNSLTGCLSENLEPQDEVVISVLDEFQINLVDSTCNENGSYFANYELLGGSGEFEVITESSGGLDGNIYITDVLEGDFIDTITIVDNFCQSTEITFITNIACSCRDTASDFSLDAIIACSSDDIVPVLQESFKTGIENPVTFFQIFSRDNTGAIDEILFDTLTYDESNPFIPFSDKYENGRTYFALPLLSERINGEIDLNYRCINEIVSQPFSFRFYRDPEPIILGDDVVCSNQLEVKYDVSTDNSANDFDWSISGDASFINVGNSIYVDFESASSVDVSIVETYNPIDLAGDLSCIGNDMINITVTEDIAPDKIELVLFDPGLLNALGPDDLCYKWIAVSKSTGDIVVEGPETKTWIVGEDLDLDNLIYICISSNPVNGSCDETKCPTFNYLNSIGPVAAKETDWSSLEIYPNPTNFELLIKHDEFNGNENIKVFNSVGNKINVEVKFVGEIIKVDTKNLNQGLYYISISNHMNGMFVTRRFIKI